MPTKKVTTNTVCILNLQKAADWLKSRKFAMAKFYN